MALPLIEYSYKSRNERVVGYEVAGEEQPIVYTTENTLSSAEIGELIWAAYRQIFSEHQILSSTRQKFLESQIRNGQITVRDFIRGLLLSDPFRRLNYDTNSNYRFVEICVQRVLGRDIYNEREKIAWSIVVAQQGIQGFVDTLLNSDEYQDNFGFDTVPYQRRRILPQRSGGETPFNLKTPRYGAYHRSQLGFPQTVWQNVVRRFVPQEQQATEGNPSLYLGMAREVGRRDTNIPRVSTTNMNYLALVPRK